MHLKTSFLLFALFFTLQGIAQKSYIRGVVFDGKTGEFLPGVTIVVEGTQTGTMTDLDGKFSLKVPSGTHDIRISYISYETVNLKNIIVKDNDVTVLDDIGLSEASVELNEVVVTGQAKRNTESSLMAAKRLSANLFDGISAANFKKIGDSDAASSMKRVTGVSVSDGKYVYVRGLGDRYTKNMLNGVDIPGLDPDRNTLQMDIFPTNVIDNIIVHKSFTPDLPADFTGGLIDINTKDFPSKKEGSISTSMGYNPDYHFNSDFLTYDGGKTDFLGFDDGTRKIPATTDIPSFPMVVGNPEGEDAQRYKAIMNSFNPNMAAYKEQNLMDFGFGASFGNQISVNDVKIGYSAALNYSKNTEFYEDAEFARYGIQQISPDIYEMEQREQQIGNYAKDYTLLSGMTGLALKTLKSKYRINLLHLQNGESEAGIFDYSGSDQGSNFDAMQHALDYNQRSLSNVLIDGNHNLYETGWNINWKISPTLSKMYNPDIRFTRYELMDGGDYGIGTEVGFPERIWRELQEYSLAGILHVTKKTQLFGRKTKINFGGSETYKQRDFMIRTFALNIRNIPLTGNPDELLYEENIWPYNGDVTRGTTYEARFIPNNSNAFNARTNNAAGYVSTEYEITDNIRTNLGVRVENYKQYYTGQNQLGSIVMNDSLVMDETSLFPSINFVYNLTSYQNLRASYTKTIARPSFKEFSYAEIYDPITGRTFIGGMFTDENSTGEVFWDGNLQSTNIHNFDLRWEFLGANEEMISVSGYYKKINNPIEIVQFAKQIGAFQPRNVGDGDIWGAEFEFRLNLDIITDMAKNFSVISNITLTKSQIKMSKTEYNTRVKNARTGESIDKYRDMAGQAPYIINTGLSYNGGEKGFWNDLEAGIYYNVQGKTLYYVGIADRPDIYTDPFHSLNININKAIGNDKRFRMGFKASNVLNDNKAKIFESFRAEDQYFERLYIGRTFKISLSYALF